VEKLLASVLDHSPGNYEREKQKGEKVMPGGGQKQKKVVRKKRGSLCTGKGGKKIPQGDEGGWQRDRGRQQLNAERKRLGDVLTI